MEKMPGTLVRHISSTLAVERRRMVIHLRRQGLTTEEIVTRFEQDGITNPKTGRPWTNYTIYADMKLMMREAREEASREALYYRADILSQYQTLLQNAWKETPIKVGTILRILGELRSMLGTDAPQVLVVSQVENQLRMALERLEVEFADEPALLERAVRAIVGPHMDIVTSGAAEGPRAVN